MKIDTEDFRAHEGKKVDLKKWATAVKDVDTENIPYYLVLRKYFNLNPSLEFRCFVRNHTLLCMCQRDLNHFDFLFPMRDLLVSQNILQ